MVVLGVIIIIIAATVAVITVSAGRSGGRVFALLLFGRELWRGIIMRGRGRGVRGEVRQVHLVRVDFVHRKDLPLQHCSNVAIVIVIVMSTIV